MTRGTSVSMKWYSESVPARYAPMSSRLEAVTIRSTASSSTCHAHQVPMMTTTTVATRSVTETPTGRARVRVTSTQAEFSPTPVPVRSSRLGSFENTCDGGATKPSASRFNAAGTATAAANPRHCRARRNTRRTGRRRGLIARLRPIATPPRTHRPRIEK